MSKPVVIIYRGLPGSGKTTQARHFQDAWGGTLVGRDHLRDLLFGKPGQRLSSADEKRVTETQEQLIRTSLRAGEDVLVDDMNLRNRYVRRLMEIAEQEGARYEIIDLTDVDIDVCHHRNHQRPAERQVPSEVIEDLYARFIKGRTYPLPKPTLDEDAQGEPERYTAPEGAPRAVLVDIDGTVALMDGRSPYDMTRVGEDLPNDAVVDVVQALYVSGLEVVFLSARNECAREATEAWLRKYLRVGGIRLLMRADGDYRKDAVVKRELFDRHIRHRYDIVAVLDDRKQVVDMWRSLGLTCLQVAEGDF